MVVRCCDGGNFSAEIMVVTIVRWWLWLCGGEETPACGDHIDILQKLKFCEVVLLTMDKVRKLVFKKQNEAVATGPQAIALLAISAINKSADNYTQTPLTVETRKDKQLVVSTETEEFVWGFRVDEEEEPKFSDRDIKDETSDCSAEDSSIALRLRRERGALDETEEWAGRRMDKKKIKLVDFNKNGGTKSMSIERTDEFSRKVSDIS
ncbi:hypothetical protein BVC80_1835g539 [Macleaya cordata]|uniref:Uncharacterized protein n=1 Tax=Macleaya cordata TaxID=56857 RepID=A0A200R617_MACCD|nr:hypothetical protein BVC80_1835g539 [Macleaya cordata]